MTVLLTIHQIQQLCLQPFHWYVTEKMPPRCKPQLLLTSSVVVNWRLSVHTQGDGWRELLEERLCAVGGGVTQRDAWTDRPEVAAVGPDGDWWDDEEIRAKKVEKRLHSCCGGARETDGETGERKVNQDSTEMMSSSKPHQNGGERKRQERFMERGN